MRQFRDLRSFMHYMSEMELNRERQVARQLFKKLTEQGAKKVVFGSLEELAPTGLYVSPGQLYAEAVNQGYEGTQRDLITFASHMVRTGEINGRRRGQAQNVWYALKSESLAREEIHGKIKSMQNLQENL